MDLATVMSVVQTLLTAIQTLDQLKVMCSFSDCKRELAALQSTVDTIKSVLQDAEAKQDALNNQEKKYIEELKDAVYDANDVVDEFLTLVKRKNLTEASDKVTDKVRSFLSRFKLLTHHLSDKVKQVNKKLETIASNSSKFSFKVDSKPIRFSMEETSSFVPADNKIIGRDEDVENIVGMLLDSNHVHKSDVSFLSIVGMGGLGKTALAQLVFNDPRVKSAFQLTRWTCIADQDQQLWNLTKLLGKVMRKPALSKEQMYCEVREQLGGKKYLLVLDDVWTESYHRWQEFEEFLKVGKSGSRIVVTTRSKKTTQMVGGDQVHELRGLSEENSWCLFERMAFLPKQRETPNNDLISLGKNIIKKCSHVPLAIKVVGSLLRGESKTKWKSFEEKGLANLSEGDDTITNVLKLSYHQLDFSLKNCFAYCAIFPKGFEIRKIMLISLWMAQGYINNEYVGEEYFLMLLQRCFFQGVSEDEYGEIEQFKIHDLLHDIAEQVAGEEICRLSTDSVNVSKRVRHLSLMCDRDTQEIFSKTRIRTYLRVNKDPWSKGNADRLLAGKLVANWTCLRSLDLSRLAAESLPETIGKLFHLRYLNLSESRTLKELPTSIAKLVNLQTLDLYRCINLRELPNDVSKLVDLSTLDVTSSGLLHMPPGMGALTRLHALGLFVVGREGSDGNECFDGLEDLFSLNNLKGYLEICIRICKNANYIKAGHVGGNYLKGKEHLIGICIDFKKGQEYGNKESEQVLLEEMQPHHGLKELSITGYHGETMPRWSGSEDKSAFFHLPNLVSLQIRDCRELRCLPSLEKLSHLKKLTLSKLPEVKYVVNVNLDVPGSSEGSPFFPCLENLDISKLPKLKGWWPKSKSGVRNEHQSWESSPSFAQLKCLNMIDCPEMTSIPTCPSLETLHVQDSDRILEWSDMERCGPRQLTISHLEWLDSMPAKYVQCLTKIVIQNEIKVQSLGEVRMLFQTRILSSLRNVVVERCPKLRSVGGWLEQISGLQSLHIEDCPDLLDSIQWRYLPQSLQSLSLVNFAELEELPSGISYCTALRSLMIRDCPQLRSIPNWIPKLTCLEEVQFRNCSQSLKERCQKPNGEDWPLIQHIPLVRIRDKLPKYTYFVFAGTSRSPMPLDGSVNLSCLADHIPYLF